MPSIINATTTNGLVTSADNSGSLQLATNSGTTAITIDTSGNVGIGTTTPTIKLDVRGGNIKVSAGASGTSDAFINFGSNANNQIYGGDGSNLMDFTVNGTRRTRIDSSGNYLVGSGVTTSTSFSGGVILLAATGVAAGGQVRVNKQDAGTATIFSGQYYGQVGSITMSDSALAFNTTSDYRLKDNITPMVGALEKVKQLNPVTYTWKRDNSTGQGFIAHEIQAIVPDCVVGEKDAVEIVDDVDAEGKIIGTKEAPSYQQVDYSKLVATLTAAIQELNAKVDAQAAEIQALKGVA